MRERATAFRANGAWWIAHNDGTIDRATREQSARLTAAHTGEQSQQSSRRKNPTAAAAYRSSVLRELRAMGYRAEDARAILSRWATAIARNAGHGDPSVLLAQIRQVEQSPRSLEVQRKKRRANPAWRCDGLERVGCAGGAKVKRRKKTKKVKKKLAKRANPQKKARKKGWICEAPKRRGCAGAAKVRSRPKRRKRKRV